MVSPGDDAPAVRVVVVDVSQSMNARADNVTAFERARATAAKYLAFSPGVRADLVLAGAVPRAVFDVPSTNFGALREALASARVRPEGLDANAALGSAAELYMATGNDGSRRRELVIISDFQRTNWAGADFSRLPENTFIEFESVAPAAPPPNMAILGIHTAGRMQPGVPTRVQVEVANYSDAPRQAQVAVEVGQSVQRIEGPCPPMGKVLLSANMVLQDAGWPTGRARLLNAGDGLPEDDSRWFAVEVRPAPTFALITRQDSAPSVLSSYFLERSLAPFNGTGRSYERVVRLDPMRLTRESLLPADMLVLDHPGKLSVADAELLSSLVRRGKPMLYVAAEPVDATNLERFSEAAATDLQLPVRFLPPASPRNRQGLILADFQTDQSPFRVFGDSARAAMAPIRFSGGLDSAPVEDGIENEVLATLNDDSAWLVRTPCAAGSVAVINADLGASTLATSPTFVPMIHELVESMLGGGGVREPAPCGRRVARFLPSDAGSAEALTIVSDDSGDTNLGKLAEEPTGVLWDWPEAGPPGIYRVMRGEDTLLALATSADAAESDLQALLPPELVNRQAGGRQAHYRSLDAEQQHHDVAWSWLAVACLGCMMLELLVHGLKARA